MIDHELKALGNLVLRNAAYREFGRFVEKYLHAGAGLDTGELERGLSEVLSVYGRASDRTAPDKLAIVVTRPSKARVMYSTMLQAFEDKLALRIEVHDRLVFERRCGEWYYVEDASKG